jgi:hypothetical protein
LSANPRCQVVDMVTGITIILMASRQGIRLRRQNERKHVMNLQDVEIGRKYIWEWDDEHRYFATALRKKTASACSSSWVTR